MKNVIAEVLVFLFRHWKREWKTALSIAAFMIGATVADLFMPVYSGRLVDAIVRGPGAREQAFHDALYSVAAMAILGALLIAGRQIGFKGICSLTTRIMTRMAADAFWRVERFSSDWHANNFAGSIVRRITRGMWAVDLMDDTLLLALLPALVALVGSAFVLGARWPGMGLLLIAASACYVTISVMLATRYVAPAARLSNAQDTRLGGALADSITCNGVVKAFGAESREDERVDRILQKWSARTYRTWMRYTLSSTWQGGLLLVLRTAIALYAVLLWRRGAAGAGDVTFVLTSYFVVHGYLRDVGQHVANLQRSANEMEEMVKLENEPLGIEDRPRAADLKVVTGSIVFENVTFRYGSHATPLFSGFSLTIPAGERVGLVGHSGSGKTTFVKLLHRLYDINEGRISIDGQDITGVTQTSLRTQLALVPQEPILFHRSLAENIAYGRPDATLREIEAAARLANAHEFISRQPKGYATLVGERGVKLSGGERQRVALARAFLANAPVLVLDEATSSLDAESEAAIQDATGRLMAGRTAIVIAHRLSTVRILDRILVFDSGRIVEEGTHEALVNKPGGTYRRLFEKQALGLISDVEHAPMAQ
ncbi:MAG TPA: ABC transporter ATP-binding protein [Bryobacteraceae bacterium]|jgi:ATP-binding cassette subfamily B protein|nr:ABC transporter ATP-binding protein [Bryobacteraceae bacterium]